MKLKFRIIQTLVLYIRFVCVCVDGCGYGEDVDVDITMLFKRGIRNSKRKKKKSKSYAIELYCIVYEPNSLGIVNAV